MVGLNVLFTMPPATIINVAQRYKYTMNSWDILKQNEARVFAEKSRGLEPSGGKYILTEAEE